jgi:hypothetical protein
MIENTLPKYLLMRTCILGFRAITPFSIFWVSFSIAEPPHTAFRRFLLTWSIIETGFWLLVYLPRKRTLQASAQHPQPLEKEERKELFWRCWDKIPYPEYYISRWFLGARPGEVRRENVREFFAWALLNRGTESDEERRKRRQAHPEDSNAEERELNEYADGIETMLGRKLEPGWGGAKSLRLTIDEVNMLHRPFVWYMVRVLILRYSVKLTTIDRYASRHPHRCPSALLRLHTLSHPPSLVASHIPTANRQSHYASHLIRT